MENAFEFRWQPLFRGRGLPRPSPRRPQTVSPAPYRASAKTRSLALVPSARGKSG